MNSTFASQTCMSAFALTFIFVVGCGSGNPRTYAVKGMVTFPDGTPLRGGIVELETTDPKGKIFNARGKIGLDGSFRLTTFNEGDGAIPGEHRAVVFPPTPDLKKLNNEEKDKAPLPRPIIHPRFQKYETSKLIVTVKAEANTIPLRVEKPK